MLGGRPVDELVLVLDLTLGLDRPVGRYGRVALGLAQSVPAMEMNGRGAQPQPGDTVFNGRLAVLPSARIDLALVSCWSGGIGARAGIGFGEASVLLSTSPVTLRTGAAAWPVVESFAQTTFLTPTRPSIGLGGRVTISWYAGPEVLFAVVLVARSGHCCPRFPCGCP